MSNHERTTVSNGSRTVLLIKYIWDAFRGDHGTSQSWSSLSPPLIFKFQNKHKINNASTIHTHQISPFRVVISLWISFRSGISGDCDKIAFSRCILSPMNWKGNRSQPTTSFQITPWCDLIEAYDAKPPRSRILGSYLKDHAMDPGITFKNLINDF